MKAGGKQATLQALLNRHLASYEEEHSLSRKQRQVCEHIKSCRTIKMGAVGLSCTRCEKTLIHSFACRDRHCPQCQHTASKQWCEKQSDALLPVTYHHLVFTLPHELNGWVGLHPKLIYGLFFKAVWSTLKRFGEDANRLGGQIGATCVLHTWGENLSRHVHMHCLIPGGALCPAGRWINARGNFLFPVRALSRCFRGAMVSALREAATEGELPRVTEPGQIDEVLDKLMSKDWAIYSKPCEGRSKEVVGYLGRYAYRIAISDQRIEAIDSDTVRFSIKDYNNDGKRESLTLKATEFIRRFLLHVLPKGLMRIRHYGLLSNRNRREKIAYIRELLGQAVVVKKDEVHTETRSSGWNIEYRCPRCRRGLMIPYMRIRHGFGPPRLVSI